MTANLAGDFQPDGGNKEASPAYSHFIARMLGDSLWLLKHNDLAPVPRLARQARLLYRFLDATMSPDGKSLQLSDSPEYPMVMDEDRRRTQCRDRGAGADSAPGGG